MTEYCAKHETRKLKLCCTAHTVSTKHTIFYLFFCAQRPCHHHTLFTPYPSSWDISLQESWCFHIFRDRSRHRRVLVYPPIANGLSSGFRLPQLSCTFDTHRFFAQCVLYGPNDWTRSVAKEQARHDAVPSLNSGVFGREDYVHGVYC